MRQFILVVVAIASLAAFVAWMDVPAEISTDLCTGDGLPGCSTHPCAPLECAPSSCRGLSCP
jgi:hypothetical protein